MATIIARQGETTPTNIKLTAPGALVASGSGFFMSPSCCCTTPYPPPGDPAYCCANYPLLNISLEMTGWGDLTRTGYPTIEAVSDVRLDMRVLNGTHILPTSFKDFFGNPTASCQWEKLFTTTVYIRRRTPPFDDRTHTVEFYLRVRDNFGSGYLSGGISELETIPEIQANPSKRFMVCDVYKGIALSPNTAQEINNPDLWSLALDDETAFDFYAYREFSLTKRCTFHAGEVLPSIAFQRWHPTTSWGPYTPTFVPTFKVTAA